MLIRIAKHISVVLLAVFLTVILTWPFTAELGNYYTDNGDAPVGGSNMWWNFNSLRSGRIFNKQEYFNGYQLYPQPYSLVYADHAFVPSLIFSSLFSLNQQYILSVNATFFVSFVLTFVSCFYALNYFIKNRWASIIGATVFTFNPATFAHFPQHAYLLIRFFLPLIFLFAYRLFQRPNFKDAFFLGLFFTLNALSVVYYQIYALFLLLVLALIFVVVNGYKRNFQYFIRLTRSSLILLVFLPILLYFDTPYLEFNQLEGAKRSIGQNIYYSGRISDWLAAPPSNLLYKNLIFSLDSRRGELARQDPIYYEEHTLFTNFVPLLLLMGSGLYFGVIAAKKLKITGSDSDKLLSLILQIFSAIFNLKTLLQILGKFFLSFLSSPYAYFFILLVVTFMMTFGPFFLGWNSESGEIPLPFYYFYHYLPFGKGVRVPTRFQMIFYLPFAFFVAYGALHFLKKSGKYYLIFFFILLTLLVLENINFYSFDKRSYILPKVERLSQNGHLSFLDGKRVLHLPIILPDLWTTEGVYVNWMTQTGERIVNGNNAYWPQDQVALLLSFKEGVDVEKLKQLKALDVDFIIIHKDLMTYKQYETKFKQYEELYKQGIVFDQEQTQIIDLAKYNLDIKKCDLTKDFEIDLSQAKVSETEIVTNVLVLKNKGDCYLPSLYNNRYQSMNFYPNFIKYTVHFRLPVIINPSQEVVLSELNNELRVQQ